MPRYTLAIDAHRRDRCRDRGSTRGAGAGPARGADVTLIDRGEPGGGTTAGSFAWIDASAPGISPYLELRVLGVQAWRRQAQQLGRPRWLSLSGTLTWARSGDDADTLEEHARRLEAMGVGPQRLTVEQALRCEPDLHLPPDVKCVYRHEGEGWVDTRGQRSPRW